MVLAQMIRKYFEFIELVGFIAIFTKVRYETLPEAV